MLEVCFIFTQNVTYYVALLICTF